MQRLKNRSRPDLGLELAEEKIFDWEAASLQSIIDEMREQMNLHFQPGAFERGGNTKTHGLVRATFTVHDDLPEHMRKGVFATPRSYPAYIRFAGPGPDVPEDIRDVGFGSMSVKLMDVPGPKLHGRREVHPGLARRRHPHLRHARTRCENAKLQYWSTIDEPIWYFLNPKDSHLLDFVMQGLWNETQYNPLGQRYYSCVPYLLGEGQAMLYSYKPLTKVPMDHSGRAVRPGAAQLPARQHGQDAGRDRTSRSTCWSSSRPTRICMPIEDASVRWPEELSPWIPAARIHIPRQEFDIPAQMSFARNLKINPWHSLPEHRPLGNQSRARKRMYDELAKYRQHMNHVEHVEPTGNEVFELAALPMGAA